MDKSGKLMLRHQHTIRVRYSETDQMGTFYHARALDWFECARSEFIRRLMGLSYAEVEKRGVYLPVIEAFLQFLGRARYDDLLTIDATLHRPSPARLRFEMEIRLTGNGLPVVRGWTVHAFVDVHGRPIRPPKWFLDLLERAHAQKS
ncbi:MAG: thioesterase family protein [Verrucomicrobiota bacterium]|nr:acyl-CoA thioesterase [Limisphaera sp.]MDW8382226.1 thioesterase family protein [Verrucomicrobiota bacterium]